MTIRHRSIRREILKINRGIAPNRKKYNRYVKEIKKRIKRYQEEKEKCMIQYKQLRKTNPDEAEWLKLKILMTDSFINRLKYMVKADIRFFYLMLIHSPWIKWM